MSGNAYAFYDRIRLVVSEQCGKDYYKTLILTDIDLPFGEKERERIVKFLWKSLRSTIEETGNKKL